MMRGVTPWRPFESLSMLRRDMDDLFDRFFGDWEREFTPWFRSTGEYSPPIESYVEGNTFIIKADLPGLDPKDVEVSVEGNQLTIKGERKATQEHKDSDYFHREVRYGSFRRTLALPEGVKADEVKASYHDGVLEVSMPAPSTMATRKVPIEIAGEERKQLAA
jgi:HSP20 family protein